KQKFLSSISCNPRYGRLRPTGCQGDIDTWGFAILSDARSMRPDLTALMMDNKTYETFFNKTSHESQPVKQMPENLTPEEQSLFNQLLDSEKGRTRLEQEFLNQDYVFRHLADWKTHH
ncbi:DUF2220 domain-containing protein, partial [Endozoicomonas sp. SESOKO2]